MPFMSVTCETFQEERGRLKSSASRNMLLMRVTCETFQLLRGRLKGVSRNMLCMSVAAATSQPDMSWLNGVP